MGGAIDSQAKVALLGIDNFDPIDSFQIDDVGSGEAKNHAGFFEAHAKQIVDVSLGLLLKVGDGDGTELGNSALVESPSLVAVIEVDDNSLFGEIGAAGIGKSPIDSDIGIAGKFTVVAESRQAAFAIALADVEVSGTAQSVNQLLKDLLGLGGTGFG